ncbi:hypothetical protein K466DRAFT_478828, partial [Polyporus arcularius HHB13444]
MRILQQYREEAYKRHTDAERAQAWNDAGDIVKTYHTEILEYWGKQLDVNLIFAGLFSAVITAFTVQSYQLLQPAPTDASLAVLQQISSQINSFTVNPSFVNSTHSAQSVEALQSKVFRPSTAAVWINVLWFLSLLFSVVAALIALTIRQSLYMSGVGITGDLRVQARHRQYRLDGLLSWDVETSVAWVSVALQSSVACFLAGLIIFSWDLNRFLAIAVTIPALAALLFIGILYTLVPLCSPGCPY